jgi:heme-degrading monooxygenase HmoA
MIVESAILSIKPGQCAAFEAALREALPLIEATPGFLGIEVRPCLERTDQYLLLVRWRTMEDHTVGFRGSERYEKWRTALHHFYHPFPTVLHYGEPI